MPNRIRATSLTEPRESGIFDAIMNKIYPKKGTFVKDDTGIYISVVDNAKWIGEINGEWIAYQTSPHFTIDDTSIGTIVEFDSKKSLERHGSKYVLPDTVYLKQEQPYLYEYYSLTRPDLIIDEYTFRTPKPFNHLRPTYEKDQIYTKGDLLYIEPDTYDEITLPAGTHVNHLGKSVTYQAETKVKRYAVKVRSTKDNNNSDPVDTLGTDWVIDEPWAVVENGKNIVNENESLITLLAGGKGRDVAVGKFNNITQADVRYYLTVQAPIIPVEINIYSCNVLVGNGSGLVRRSFQVSAIKDLVADFSKTSSTSVEVIFTTTSTVILNPYVSITREFYWYQ